MDTCITQLPHYNQRLQCPKDSRLLSKKEKNVKYPLHSVKFFGYRLNEERPGEGRQSSIMKARAENSWRQSVSGGVCLNVTEDD